MRDPAGTGASGREPASRDAQREILEDLRPVRPLAAPWKRALRAIVPWAVAGAALVWLGAGFRSDGSLGPAAVLGVSIALLVAAAALAWLLARESVPALPAPAGLAILGVVGVIALRIATAIVIDAYCPFPVEKGEDTRLALVCSAAITAIALPCLVALFVLLRYGLATRTLPPAFLAAAAAAVGSEALWRLHCPFTNPVHVIAGHLSPIIVLAAVWLGLVFAAKRAGRRST